MRNVQHSMAQTSAEHGIKYINSAGQLNNKSVRAAIDEYLRQRNIPISNRDSDNYGKYPDYRVWANELKCGYPTFEVKLYKGRDDNSGAITGRVGPPPTYSVTGFDPRGTQPYLRMDLVVHDSVQNTVLGMIGSLPGLDAEDMSCQKITTEISAVAFASQEDISKGNENFRPNG